MGCVPDDDRRLFISYLAARLIGWVALAVAVATIVILARMAY